MRWAVPLLVAFALLRMAATFRVLAQTADEQTHIGAGLELFQQHRYWLHRDNPPLPRVVMSLAPYLGGMRVDWSNPDYGAKLHSVLYDHGTYERNLVLIRIGNLLFFAIGAWAMWAWARRELGDGGGLFALILFTMQPVILGYSALAIHDGPATAATAVALLTFSRWLARPGLARAALVAVAFALSVLCKFSCIAFVPLACLAILAIRSVRERVPLRDLMTLAVAVPLVPLIVWGGYAFTTGTLGEIAYVVDGYGPAVARFAALHPSMPIPAPAFFWGVASVLRQDRAGYAAYFIGQQRDRGWPLYFSTAIALKTTLPFLALIAAGIASTWKTPASRRRYLEAMTAAVAIVAVASRSNLDLGVRYVLPAYVPLTFAAAAAAVAMRRALAIALVAAHCIVSLAAHPDYFPYFNALGSPDPSYYLVDSNLDWGQDVLRLRSELRKRHIDHLGTALMGGADLAALHFPPTQPLNPWARPLGWAAVSDHAYRMHGANGGWKALQDEPFIRVGTSIRLYHLSLR